MTGKTGRSEEFHICEVNGDNLELGLRQSMVINTWSNS